MDQLVKFIAYIRGYLWSLVHCNGRALICQYGRVRLAKRNGTVSIGARTAIWPDIKLSCVGGRGRIARLKIGRKCSLGALRGTERRPPAGTGLQVPHHRRPAPAGSAAVLPARAPRRRQQHPGSVRDFRQPQRGLRRGNVRHHQFRSHAHQQEPPGGPLRAHLVGRSGPPLRGEAGGQALSRGRQSTQVPHQPPRRAQPAGEMDTVSACR